VNDESEILSFAEGAELILDATRSTLDTIGTSWDRFYNLFHNVVKFGITGGPAKTSLDSQFNSLISYDFILSYILTRKELGVTDDIELFKAEFYKNYQNIIRFDTARDRSTTH
jgi:hypothetical protein